MLNIAILGAFWSQLIAIGLTIILFFLVTVYNFKSRQYWQSIKEKMLLASVLSLPFLISMILKSDYALLYATIIVIFFEVAVLSLVADVKQFAKIFVVVVVSLAAYSLVVNYILRPFVFGYWPDCMSFNNPSGLHYLNLIFAFIRDLPHHFRNYGIFREPGQYAFIILIALVSNLFVLKNNRYGLVISLILIFTMLSTFSPTGVLAMAVLLVSYFVYSWREIFSQRHLVRKLAIFTVSIIMVLAGICFFVFSDNNISDTMIGSVAKVLDIRNESAKARLESVSVDVKMFFNSPIIGNDSVDVLTAIQDNTFTPGVLLAIFGLLAGLVSYVLWWKFIVSTIGRKHIITLGLVSASIFIGVSTQNLVPELFFYILPLLAYYNKSDETMLMLNNLKDKILRRRLV